MSTAVDILGVAARLVAVVADPGEPVNDLLCELDALGFVAQRVSLTAVAAVMCTPAVALVVGSGTRATAQARRACAAIRRHERLAGVPIVVVLPASRMPGADAALDAHELIVRPLRPGELLARIDRARTSAPAPAPLDIWVRAGALRLDPWSRDVWVGDSRVSLSAREFGLLHYLARHPSRVHTREHLLRAVWRGDEDVGTRAVDVQVRRVRAKLGDDLGRCIRTVRNVGYALDECAVRRIAPD